MIFDNSMTLSYNLILLIENKFNVKFPIRQIQFKGDDPDTLI
jgi:hypothetical protein